MNLNISLTDEMAEFIEAKVRTGRYTSSSDVVQEALCLLEKRDQDQEQIEKLCQLQQAWRDGIESGDFAPLNTKDIKAQGRRRLAAKA